MTTTMLTRTRMSLGQLMERPDELALVPYERITTLLPPTKEICTALESHYLDAMADLAANELPYAEYVGIGPRISGLTLFEGKRFDVWMDTITDQNVDELLSIIPKANRWDLSRAIELHPELARLKTTVGYDLTKDGSAEILDALRQGNVVGPRELHSRRLAPVRAKLRRASKTTVEIATSPVTRQILSAAGVTVLVLGGALLYSALLVANAIVMDPAIFVEIPIDQSRALICCITRWS